MRYDQRFFCPNSGSERTKVKWNLTQCPCPHSCLLFQSFSLHLTPFQLLLPLCWKNYSFVVQEFKRRVGSSSPQPFYSRNRQGKKNMDVQSRRARETSPDRMKAYMQPRVKPVKKVQVVYYLSRKGHLEHPHYMEVTHLAGQPLRLRGERSYWPIVFWCPHRDPSCYLFVCFVDRCDGTPYCA